MSVYTTPLLCIVLGSSLLHGCSSDEQAVTEVIRPVRFEQVALGNINRNLKFTGVVKADVETNLSFKVGGTLMKLNVTAGNKIKKGQLIAALDDTDAKLKYDKQLLALSKVEMQQQTASSKLTRVKGLYENNNVPLAEYESAKESYSNANAGYETEKRAVDLIKRELDYYKLYSPVDGIVLLSELAVNENLQSGQLVTVIQSGDALVVEVGLPEQYVTRAKLQQAVNINFSSIPNKTFTGSVTKVAYTVNTESSSYPVTIKIDNPKNSIRPGMPANVSFNFNSNKKISGLMVSVHAISEDQSGKFVLLVQDEKNGFGIVRKKNVKIGKISSTGFEILEGLQAGDYVITAGLSSLVDGMKVRLLK